MDKILLIDEDPGTLWDLRSALEKEGYRVVNSVAGGDTLRIIENEKPSLVFLDITIPELNGLAVLATLNDSDNCVPVVVITAFGNMETAIRAMKLGAYEYLTKPVDVHRVCAVARTALETGRHAEKLETLRDKRHEPRDRYQLIGDSPIMYHLYKTIGTIANTPNPTNILLLGESGTGKELVARAIHAYGENCGSTFVGLNCTVLPEPLLVSELFGHEKGSFTGAVDRQVGKFEAAGDGTIYLDEIGDTTLDFQKKLLRVLQEREFERIGGLESIPLRCRIIASTNQDLSYKIKAEEFREDLYFRLNVLQVTIPPLRERKEDIPLLARHFLNKYCILSGNMPRGISQEALNLLIEYDFPGNVRELENIIERCVYLDKSPIITPETIRRFLKPEVLNEANIPIVSNRLHEARRYVIELFDKKFILKLLAEHSGNVTAAAKEAEIERQSFQRLMKKYDIFSGDFRRRGEAGTKSE